MILQGSLDEYFSGVVARSDIQAPSGLTKETLEYITDLLRKNVHVCDHHDAYSALGYEYALAASEGASISKLKDIGDSALVAVGIFPGVVFKRGISLKYYANLARSVFGLLADLIRDSSFSDLYYEISVRTGKIIELLNLSAIEMQLMGWMMSTPFLHELWDVTGSVMYAQELQNRRIITVSSYFTV